MSKNPNEIYCGPPMECPLCGCAVDGVPNDEGIYEDIYCERCDVVFSDFRCVSNLFDRKDIKEAL